VRIAKIEAMRPSPFLSVKNSLNSANPTSAENTTTDTFTIAKILEFVNSSTSYDFRSR
jgi:hypothetical protein